MEKDFKEELQSLEDNFDFEPRVLHKIKGKCNNRRKKKIKRMKSVDKGVEDE